MHCSAVRSLKAWGQVSAKMSDGEYVMSIVYSNYEVGVYFPLLGGCDNINH